MNEKPRFYNFRLPVTVTQERIVAIEAHTRDEANDLLRQAINYNMHLGPGETGEVRIPRDDGIVGTGEPSPRAFATFSWLDKLLRDGQKLEDLRRRVGGFDKIAEVAIELQRHTADAFTIQVRAKNTPVFRYGSYTQNEGWLAEGPWQEIVREILRNALDKVEQIRLAEQEATTEKVKDPREGFVALASEIEDLRRKESPTISKP